VKREGEWKTRKRLAVNYRKKKRVISLTGILGLLANRKVSNTVRRRTANSRREGGGHETGKRVAYVPD